ncbi:MAG: hypothetical protein VYC34_07710, partial [Planctomycetota bacterium]|nr:hypothetical protein [Planctomycetota bacterium]
SGGLGGAMGDGASINPDISADGSVITFASTSTNLTMMGDANGPVADIYAFDRDPDGDGIFDEGNEMMTLISRSSMGEQANGYSETPRISDDDRYISFASNATNLVRCDSNNAKDVYIHDRELGKTRLLSITHDGNFPNDDSCLSALSFDGRFATFESDGDNVSIQPDENDDTDVFQIDLRPECREVEPNDTFFECTVIDFNECKYITGSLQKDCVWDIQPKCFLAAYSKPFNAVTQLGNFQGLERIIAADYNFDGVLLVPILDDGTLRLAMTAIDDGFDGTINGLSTNAPHQNFGEVTLTLTFFAENSEGGVGLQIGDPVEYVFRFEEGNEALRLGYIAPEIVGIGAEFVEVRCDDSTGSTIVNYDVDFYVIENLEPAELYCLTVVGGLDYDCNETDTALGWFDKGGNQQGGVNGVNDDVCEGIPYSELCVLADDQGRLRFAVSGGGDLNFNGLNDTVENIYFDLLDSLGIEDFYEPGASTKDASAACVIRYPRSLWEALDLAKGEAPETIFEHGKNGGYCICIRENPHDGNTIPRCGEITGNPGGGLTAASCDFDNNGMVDAGDLATLLNFWGPVN